MGAQVRVCRLAAGQSFRTSLTDVVGVVVRPSRMLGSDIAVLVQLMGQGEKFLHPDVLVRVEP